MLRKLTEDIYTLIIQANVRETLDSIPHSDQFIREIMSIFSVEQHMVKRIITILREAHKILSIEVVQEDKQNEIKKIEGYVDADLRTVKRLKNIYQNALMDEYEHQNKRRLMTHQIIKEIYNRIGMFKNTPLGQLANKAIMLEEFEYLIEKNYNEYGDQWKSKKLEELLAQTDNIIAETGAKPAENADTPASKADVDISKPAETDQTSLRAVDAISNDDASQAVSPQSVNKMIQIYGVTFFFRVQLRKYHFRQLREIIDAGSFFKRDDLKLLKDMLKTVRSNYSRDPDLEKYTDEINRLDQAVSHHILSARR